MRNALASALLLATAFAAHAQIKPGEYVFEQGRRGVLRIAPGAGDALKFHLSTVGGNFHICELEGVIRKGEARMEESAHDKLPCIVTFKPTADGIAVASRHERACSTYCGMRAHFEGNYLLPPPQCAPSQVQRTRTAFKALFDKKQYSQARATLTPVVEKCSALLSDYDEAWVRNDLAITQYHAGDSAACRETLLRWVDLARQNDDAIKNGYPPSDAEEMLRIARATRYNLKVCGAPVAVGGKSGK
jgi:hypothetical protein